MTDQNYKKILLIDDDADQTELYKFPFEMNGFDVNIQNDANQALSTAIGWMPDLILLDIIMDNIDGVEVLTQLKGNEHTKNIPVVMLTNTYDKKVVETVKALGALGYWEKTKMMPKNIVEESKKLLGVSS